MAGARVVGRPGGLEGSRGKQDLGPARRDPRAGEHERRGDAVLFLAAERRGGQIGPREDRAHSERGSPEPDPDGATYHPPGTCFARGTLEHGLSGGERLGRGATP